MASPTTLLMSRPCRQMHLPSLTSSQAAGLGWRPTSCLLIPRHPRYPLLLAHGVALPPVSGRVGCRHYYVFGKATPCPNIPLRSPFPNVPLCQVRLVCLCYSARQGVVSPLPLPEAKECAQTRGIPLPHKQYFLRRIEQVHHRLSLTTTLHSPPQHSVNSAVLRNSPALNPQQPATTRDNPQQPSNHQPFHDPQTLKNCVTLFV